MLSIYSLKETLTFWLDNERRNLVVLNFFDIRNILTQYFLTKTRKISGLLKIFLGYIKPLSSQSSLKIPK